MKKLSKLAAILAAGMMLFGFAGCAEEKEPADPNPTVTVNKDGTVTILIQEGKLGLMSCNGTVTENPDKVQCQTSSNGAYYENFPSAGSGNTFDDTKTPGQVSYVVNTDTEGEYVLTMHYAFGGNCDYLRDAYVYVNGVQVTHTDTNGLDAANDTLNFAYTVKNWSVWKDASCKINLVKGDNSILLKSANGATRTVTYQSSWANWDKLAAVPADQQITGKVVSLPNIDYMALTSPKKTPAVNLAAGSSGSAYFSFKAYSFREDWGTVTASESGTAFKSGTSVTVTAEPAAGYVFDCWTGTVTSNKASQTISVTKDIALAAHFKPADYSVTIPAGYATVCDDSGTKYTVTGGYGGTEIVLNTLADLTTYKSAISGNDPYIIKVTARINTGSNVSTTFDIGSNKTIIGEAGKDYGFKNINPKISGENVIIRNLHFGDVIGDDFYKGSGNDAMSIKGGKHVWIDHCEFSSSLTPRDWQGNEISFSSYKSAGGVVDLEGESCSEETKWMKDFYDGLLDISEQSRFITVSNCYFHDHWKACLCGGSNDKEESQPQGSQVRMTFCKNYFKDIHARQPLFRFGKAHIYSSYLYGAGSSESTGIEVRAESTVLVDNVYFENLYSGREVGCWNSSKGLGEGSWRVEKCNLSISSTNNSFTPPYDWSSDIISNGNCQTGLPSTAGIEKAE